MDEVGRKFQERTKNEIQTWERYLATNPDDPEIRGIIVGLNHALAFYNTASEKQSYLAGGSFL